MPFLTPYPIEAVSVPEADGFWESRFGDKIL